MKKILLTSLLTFNACAVNEPLCEKYKLEDFRAISPLRQEEQSRYDDQDICDIFYGKDLKDCGVNNEGPTPSPSPEPDNK